MVIGLGVSLDTSFNFPYWTLVVKKLGQRLLLKLEKLALFPPLVITWGLRYIHDDFLQALEILNEYWSLNHHIKLKYTPVDELDDLLLSAWVKFKMDKNRSFYVAKLIFHIEELFRLDFLNFIKVLLRSHVGVLWGLIELVTIRKINTRFIKEIDEAITRFKNDGVFFLDAEHLIIKELFL